MPSCFLIRNCTTAPQVYSRLIKPRGDPGNLLEVVGSLAPCTMHMHTHHVTVLRGLHPLARVASPCPTTLCVCGEFTVPYPTFHVILGALGVQSLTSHPGTRAGEQEAHPAGRGRDDRGVPYHAESTLSSQCSSAHKAVFYLNK